MPTAEHPGTIDALHAGLRWCAARPPEGHHPPRHQTVEHPGRRRGRPAGPKIIDFGVAKATSQRLTERTLFTELGQWIGTPEYMSPEQAELTGLDVDTRSDVYSLGVVLYELLAGTQPFDSNGIADRRLRRDAAADSRGRTAEAEHPSFEPLAVHLRRRCRAAADRHPTA